MPDLRNACTGSEPLEEARPADVLVLFGAMGDLAHKKIFPALYHIVQRRHLDIPVIGVAKAGRTDEHLKERASDSVRQQGGNIDEDTLAKLLNLLHYVGGDYQEPATFDRSSDQNLPEGFPHSKELIQGKRSRVRHCVLCRKGDRLRRGSGGSLIRVDTNAPKHLDSEP